MENKMSFDEYREHLTKAGIIDCSCHICPPCSDCIRASNLYEEYAEGGGVNMAKKCEVCLGTGQYEGMFCACSEGKLLRARSQAEMKAEQLAQEEKKQVKIKIVKKESAPITPKEELISTLNNPFQIGDWVKFANTPDKFLNGKRGYILKVNELDKKLFVQSVGLSKYVGHRDVCGWIKFHEVVLLPTETTDEGIEFMMDLSLLTHDEKWFKELTNQKIKGR